MEQVTIWYLHDSDKSKGIIDAIKNMGLMVNSIEGYDLHGANIVEHEINLVIIDIYKDSPEKILKAMSSDLRVHSYLKFVLMPRKEIKTASKISYNLLHVEFISRPVFIREFLLLLEKSVIVERYREIMKFISKEAETRIETYEGLMDINRKNIFESEKEKQAFEKILIYEKNLMREQARLNRAIKDFTLMRQSEFFDMKNRIKAEEMLADLRRKELIDAKDVIVAQESVIDFSAIELKDAHEILHAAENAAELARMEAIDLHKKLEKEKLLNEKLKHENKDLKDQIKKIKSKK